MIVCMYADEAFKRITEITVPAWRRYCAEQGFKFFLQDRPIVPSDRHPSWNKVQLVHKCLNLSDLVFCVDADTVPLKTVAEFVPSADVATGTDWNGICMAAFFVRDSQWSRWFLSTVFQLGEYARPEDFGGVPHPKYEQNTVKALVRDFPEVSAHVTIRTGLLTEGEEAGAVLHVPCLPLDERCRKLAEHVKAV